MRQEKLQINHAVPRWPSDVYREVYAQRNGVAVVTTELTNLIYSNFRPAVDDSQSQLHMNVADEVDQRSRTNRALRD